MRPLSFGLWPLAIAIVLSTALLTTTYKTIKSDRGTISVKGCAESQIVSDYVQWQGSIKATAETQLAAYEKLEADLAEVLSFLESRGITPAAVSIKPIISSVNYRYTPKGRATNEIESYVLSQEFAISSSDVPLITSISHEVTTLIKKGLLLNSNAPQYFYLKIDELKIEMLGQAAKDAKQRADTILSKGGANAGTLRSAHQGVFQITPAFATYVSDYGEFDTSSIDKRIKAVVTMEFGID